MVKVQVCLIAKAKYDRIRNDACLPKWKFDSRVGTIVAVLELVDCQASNHVYEFIRPSSRVFRLTTSLESRRMPVNPENQYFTPASKKCDNRSH